MLQVVNPFDGMLLGSVATASPEDVAEAVDVAYATYQTVLRHMPTFERAGILRRAGEEIRLNVEELTDIVVAEAGKPIRDVRRELGRASTLLDLAADHVMVQTGQVLPMDVVESGVNRHGYSVRVPVGVVAAIAPSNSPVNLTINKLGPAIAAGNAMVLKPADQTPFSALWLAAAFKRAGLPDGALNVVIGDVENTAEPLVRHPRVRMVSITGGVPAGLAVVRAAGIKKVTLELGSSAANVIRADADVEAAAKSLVTSAYLSSGQACISAQRIYVHSSRIEEFVKIFVPLTEAMVIGDPRDPATEIGPMVNQDHVLTVKGWIDEAVAEGAELVTGGGEYMRTLRPTLVRNVPAHCTLSSSEVFAPIAVLESFETDEEAIEKVNSSVFGLQAGVFTNDLTQAFRYAKDIDVGALWINDSSRYRQDNYPFGGMKMSGVGREGVQYAMEEMTEWKFVGIKLGPSQSLL
jgi:acyl-CoA reductase-like NAD-dependent aldehyde dehydrogenase